MRTAVRVAVVMVAVGIGSSAGVVSGVYSYEGSDFSYDSFTRTKISTCDQEADSHQTHADYYWGTTTTGGTFAGSLMTKFLSVKNF